MVIEKIKLRNIPDVTTISISHGCYESRRKVYSTSTVFVCVCVFFFQFSLDMKFVGRTSRGYPGFFIHLPFAVRALIFLVRRI